MRLARISIQSSSAAGGAATALAPPRRLPAAPHRPATASAIEGSSRLAQTGASFRRARGACGSGAWPAVAHSAPNVLRCSPSAGGAGGSTFLEEGLGATSLLDTESGDRVAALQAALDDYRNAACGPAKSAGVHGVDTLGGPRYYDRTGTPFDLETLTRHLEDPDYRFLARTRVGALEVVTAWLGIDQALDRAGAPLIFGTAILVDTDTGQLFDDREYLASTDEEAMAQHQAVTNRLRRESG